MYMFECVCMCVSEYVCVCVRMGESAHDDVHMPQTFQCTSCSQWQFQAANYTQIVLIHD